MPSNRFPPAGQTLLLAALVLLSLAACAKAPYTGRNQLMLISQSQAVTMGHQATQQVLEKEKIIRGTPQAERLDRLGRRIAAQAGNQGYDWRFYLVDDTDQINAFALPGGGVFVYTALLNLAPTNDQLATVVAHEIAHVLARHGSERMSMQLAAQYGGQIAGSAIGMDNPQAANIFRQAYGMGAQVGVLLPYSRKQEHEADEIGLVLMAKAGYDPAAAVDFWRKMAAQKSGAPPEFLSTHPADSSRIQAIQEAVPEIRAKYYRPR